jgi:hypothetical protein
MQPSLITRSGRWTTCHGSGVQVTPPVRTISIQPPRGHALPAAMIDPRERNGADIGGGSDGGGGGGGNGR